MKLAIGRLGMGIACLTAVVGTARADVGATFSGSILVFPRLRHNFCRRTGYEPPCLTIGQVSCSDGSIRGRER